ncbi:MAG: hypothetical protein A2151_07320 [Candidatus Muproteobacteria bacterium RBG_16_65_34]|uniref:DUF2269 domain-containing protein n=1 Tax=Candidatus Muproteobacteria bacterium RBG_16_65_34 TaxID=1817760 RepID=A0A1F6TUG3_9PROT|nr:MAG: hypothetical protein A2151_07320 [Candidatus Muproteobacteria bacterium RBG_16_65_34]
MKKTAKLLHVIGLIMFFGGILPSIVMNSVVGASTDAVLIYHQRLFVSAFTWALTIPGMWILIVAGSLTALARKYRLIEHRWLIAKLALATLILINGTFILAPLVSQVTDIAEQSAARGQLLPIYMPLKAKEDMYGIANFLMLVIAFLLAVYKPGFRRAQQGAPAGRAESGASLS